MSNEEIRKNISSIYPLSPMQQGMLFHSLYAPYSGVYLEQMTLGLKGNINVAAFERAWQKVLDRHSILRTFFVWENRQTPLQVVLKQVNVPWNTLDWRELSSNEQQQQLKQLLQTQREQGFNLSQAPLMRCTLVRLGEDNYKFIWSHHHILMDGWCLSIIFKEILIFYKAHLLGENCQLPKPRPYQDYIAWLNSQDKSAAIEFWQQTLQGFSAPTPLVMDKTQFLKEQQYKTADYQERTSSLSPECTQKLLHIAQQHHVTLSTVVQAAWALLLSRYSGEKDVVFGVTVSGRPPSLSEIENMVGLFINTLPLRVQVSTQEQLLPWLQKIQQSMVELQEYFYTPLVDIQATSEIPGGIPLFESIVVFENYPIDNSLLNEEGSLHLGDVEVFEQTNYPLTLVAVPGDKLSVRISYDTARFSSNTIEWILGYLQTVLSAIAIVENPSHKVAQLPLLSEVERHKLLVEWNNTATDYPSDKCIHQLFEQQVEKTPNSIAVVFEEEQLTYQQLNQKANQLAHYLQTLGVKPEVLVGICIEYSIDMIVGLLGILKAGGVYVPLDPNYPQERLAFMQEDSNVHIILTQRPLLEKISPQNAHIVCLDRDRDVIAREGVENLDRQTTLDDLAYAIYTSGSTGKPKAVLGTLRGIVNRLHWIWEMLPFGADEICSQKTSINFGDHVAEIFSPLLKGIPLVIVPDDIRGDIPRLMSLLSDRKVTRIVLVPSLLKAILENAPQQLTKLRYLKYVFCSGEVLPLTLAKEFHQKISSARLFNLYGSSEVAADVTCFEVKLRIANQIEAKSKEKLDALKNLPSGSGDRETAVLHKEIIHLQLVDEPRADLGEALEKYLKRNTIPIGKPISNTQIYILDKYGNLLPPGVTGELYVGGDGLAKGYLNLPELTREKFIPNPFVKDRGKSKKAQAERLFRTGDLARWQPDGNIEFVGRIDHQVKVRGFRIELGEIEAVLSTHPQIQQVVVIAIEDIPGSKRLVAYIVSEDESLSTHHLREFLKQKLPEYMMPSAFVILDTLPLTPSGKIDRKALPAPDGEISREHEYVPPRTSGEEIIANIFASILGVQNVGIHDNFFELGGHSLLATRLISRLRVAFEVEIELSAVFSSPTVAQLEQTLTQLRSTNSALSLPPIQPRTQNQQLPLSFAQERLWFLNQLEGSSATYNMPGAIRVTGKLDINALQQALSEIVRRHEVLRTSFRTVNGTPIQVIHPEATMNISVADLQQLEATERESVLHQQAQLAAITPFDLETAPLIRCSLLQLDAREYVLLLTMHHIVSDGWSMGIFSQELSTLYQAFSAGKPSPLAELPIQYADFAVWQRQWLSGKVLETQLNYWLSQLEGAPELLQLPTDRPRPTVQTFRGTTQSFSLNTDLKEKLQTLSRNSGTTLFMTLHAAFATLLYRYSGQLDILIGSPIANRNCSEIESLIGFFANTLVLKTRFEDNPSFENLLAQVRETTLEAYKHQDVPFEQVVEVLQPQRSLSHAPLFQVMFVLQNAPMGELELPGVTLKLLSSQTETARFDLTVSMQQTSEALVGSWEYNTDLFDGSTIERMTAHFQNLCSAIVENPQQKISELPLLTDSEQEQVLHSYNNIATTYLLDKYVHFLSSNNLQIYILDNHQQLVPLSVEGEIYLGNCDLLPDKLHPEPEKFISFIEHTQLGKLLKTGEWGCRRVDGSLELLGKEHRIVTVNGQRINLQRIEQALQTAKGVEDCYVMVRNQKLVAYVVKDGSWSREFLHHYLKSQLPGYPLPCIYVPVSALPLTSFGEVDEVGLASISIIDSELINTWEEQIGSQAEIDKVAVFIEPNVKTISPIHLEELLPSTQAIFNQGSTPVETPRTARGKESSSLLEIKSPAISHEEVLIFPESSPETLGEMLQKTAGKFPHKGITYINSDGSEQVQSYAQLLEDAQRILGGFRKLGIKPQDKVILQLKENKDFISAFWGCVLGGFIPVPVVIPVSYDQPNVNLNKLQNSWQMLERPLVLTDKKSLSELKKWSQNLNDDNFKLETIESLQKFSTDKDYYNAQPEDLALFMLTSGSTGMSKVVQLSHLNLLSRTIGSIQMNNFTQEDITLNWMSLDHVAGLIYFHIRDIYLGCKQIHATSQLVIEKPLRWLDWIDAFGVTVTFAPNFAYSLINDFVQEIEKQNWNLSSIRLMLNGAEQIVAATARRFLKLLAPFGLSGDAMTPSWGMAEVSSGITYSDNFSLLSSSDDNSFVNLGKPIRGTCLRIVNQDMEVLSEGEIGLLQVKGLTVTSGYYQNPKANKEAFTEDGWFNTGDLGFIKDGCLTITGRQKDIIIINGVNYYSHEIEAIVEELGEVEVSYTAACGVCVASNNTEELVIFFTPYVSEKNQLLELLKKVREQVVKYCGINPSYLIPIDKELIPKTSIGKIQRSLLKQRFECGEFKSLRQSVDLLLGNTNTIPNWFYRKVWKIKKNKNSLLNYSSHKTLTLIFTDNLGLATRLTEELSQTVQPYAQVTIGSNFAQISPNHYSIVPGNPQHYRLLIDSLRQNSQVISQILHLWNYNEQTEKISSLENLESTQQQGIYSLLFLVQALEEIQGKQQAVKLLWIANQSQLVHPTDKIQPEKSTVLGLLKTVSQEMPWLTTRHLDLPLAPELNNSYIWQELYSADKELEVAIRNRERFVSGLEPVDMTAKEKQKIPIIPGGTYLITGGLGGIGTVIAKYLLEHYQAHLILVGRTQIEDNNEEASTKLQRYQELEKLPGSIIYQTVDICDLVGLQQVVEKATQEWRTQLDGVFHMAGIIQETPIEKETPENIAAVLRPKVSGTWVLHQLLKDKENALFVHFCSVNGFFGGTNVAAYSAANSFQSAWSDYQQQNGFQSYCCSWSMWNETGISHGYQFQELSRAKGYFIITPQQGFYSFLAALSGSEHNLLIGLDGTKTNVEHLIRDCQPKQKLTAYFTSPTPELAALSLQKLQLHDRFGIPNQINFVQLEQIPLTQRGEINREQIAAIYGGLNTSEQTKPRNQTERQLVEIFQEVLNLPSVGIHDNFFSLGGHSLLAVRLMSEIQQQFQKNLPLATLFQNPTIERLALLVGSDSGAELWSPLVPIQQNGSLPPLFCVPGAGGNVLYFHHLAQYLGNNQPLYGLQAQGLDGETEPHKSVEEIASQHIKAIQTVQPVGPYFLAGHSFGSHVVFEMANQLQLIGKSVAYVGILDTHAPTSQANHQNDFSNWDNAKWIYRMAEVIEDIVGENLFLSYETLTSLTREQQLNYFKQKLEIVGFLPAQTDIKMVRGLLQVFQTQCQIKYEPEKTYKTPITLFCAREINPEQESSSHIFQEPTWGWNQFSDGEVEIHIVPGNHVSMLSEPHVKVLAQQMQISLEQAQKTHQLEK
ncbi:SDR family NAD(P)-dependent oxidoreductase [Nostoc sp. UIC 10890]